MADSSTLFQGMAVGGVIISVLGTGSTLFLEKKNPSVKSVMRDFIIGAVLIAIVMQILPESTSSFVKMVLAFLPVAASSAAGAMKGGAMTSSGDGAGSDEMEIKVGVPNF